ncbi:MAG: DUF58 domain-containing protein [Lachnospiraceae bacterium]|nr:DUF58 domain-containing protein [Lachnospiraceae bacterium]
MKLLIAFLLAVLVFWVQTLMYRRLWNQNLKASLSFDRDVLYEGQTNELVEVIENRKYMPIPILQVKFSITRTFLFEKRNNTNVTDKYYRSDFFTIMPWQKITRTYPFVCSKRGFYTTDDLDLICRSFFMNERMIETRRGSESVCVLPARIRHQDLPDEVNNLLGETEKNMRLNEDPFTFAGIRDYQPFDNIRSINWKVTARHDNLSVNTFNTTFSKKVVLLLNVEANSMMHAAEIAEWAIKIAAHLASRFISSHIPTALYTNGVDISAVRTGIGSAAIAVKNKKDKDATLSYVSMEAGADMSHIRAIEVTLARLSYATTSCPFVSLMDERIGKDGQSVEYIVISNYRKKEITSRFEALRSGGYSVHFIIPAMYSEEREDEFKAEQYTWWESKD